MSADPTEHDTRTPNLRRDGFDLDAHARHVAAGFCPALDGKTYCSGRAGHLEDHWAPLLNPDGTTKRVYWWWAPGSTGRKHANDAGVSR